MVSPHGIQQLAKAEMKRFHNPPPGESKENVGACDGDRSCLFTEIATVYEIKRIYGHLLNPILKAMNTLPTLYTYRSPDGQEYLEDPNLKDVYHMAQTFRVL